MIDDLIAQLDALGEEEFYYFPATTKAKINEAKAALKSQAARIAELEAALRVYECNGKCGHCLGAVRKKYCGRIARAALEGGEDE